MKILNMLKHAQEMKNFQEKLKTIQVDKHSRHAHLEPLQEGVEQMLTDIDIAKGQIQQFVLESGELLKEHITEQTVETITEKSMQVKSQVEKISSRFHMLEKSVHEAYTT